MRLIFAGTPEAAVPSLEALGASAHEIVRVVTRPPAPIGRRRVLTPSPVQRTADRLGVPVLAASRLDVAATAAIAADAPDLAVVVAYGALVREPLLSTPRLGWINLHFSLLPRWRGAAPVQHAVIAGDAVSGVSVFELEAGLDTGPVLAEHRVPIGDRETGGDLLDRLAVVGAQALVDVVDRLAEGSVVAEPQVGEPTLAPKLTAADGRLDWAHPAGRVFDRIRGCTPEPGAWTQLSGRRLKVLEAAPAGDLAPLRPGEVRAADGRVVVGCGTGALELVRVQPDGRTVMAAADWLRGAGTAPVLG